MTRWAAVVAVFAGVAGCGLMTPKQAVSGVLTAEEIACALLQASLGLDDPVVIQDVCRISNAVSPELRKLLEGNHVAMQRKAAMVHAGPR